MFVGRHQDGWASGRDVRWLHWTHPRVGLRSVAGQRGPDVSTVSGHLLRPAAATSSLPTALRVAAPQASVQVEGPGFLVLQLPDGTQAYTRDGDFYLGALGTLVTRQGWPVLGESGVIELDPANPAPAAISPTGEVSQGAEVRGVLRLVEFNRPELLAATDLGHRFAVHPDLRVREALGTWLRPKMGDRESWWPGAVTATAEGQTSPASCLGHSAPAVW